MSYLPELTPLEQLEELYRYLTDWVNSQEKRLKAREDVLRQQEADLQKLTRG